MRYLLVAVVLLGCAPSAARSSAARRELTLLHLADLHSHLFPERMTLTAQDERYGLGASGDTVSVGGAARIATLLEQERARADVSITLDAGDLLEGTAVYTLFGGVPEMRVLDALAVDADALGNHDLSPGPDRLRALRRYAPGTPLLAANLADDVPGLAAPSALVERGGLRVRVIGLGRSPDGAPDVADCAARVQRIVDAERDADVTVVLSHLGTELDEALVPLTAGVDVLLGGHTHDVLAPPRAVADCGPGLAARRGCRPHPVLVVHSGAYGRYVGRVTLTVASDGAAPTSVMAGRRSDVVGSRAALLPVTDAIEEHPGVLALLEPYRRALSAAGLDRPIAVVPHAVSRAAERGGDSALGDLVTRTMRAATGADLAVINSTGIRDDLPAGELTVEDVFRVLPFDDRLVTVSVSGDSLLDVVEQIRSDSCGRGRASQAQLDGGTLLLACDGRGSAELRVGGKPVVTAGTYRVAIVSFLADAGQWFQGAASDGGTDDAGLVRDAFLDAVRRLPPCAGDGGYALPCISGAAGAERDGRIAWR